MKGGKLPGLDGLRAIAVGLVLLFHRFLLPVGWLGVQIFFVLSGYLITRILVQAKEQPFASYLRNFYGRRALRIFPLYYAVIALLGLATVAGVHLAGVREGLPFAASYTYNFWYATQATDFSPYITHFWTLCVEEQFYLLWPFAIFLCPAPRLKQFFVAVVLLGPLLRLLGAFWLARPGATVLFDPSVALDVLTTTHLDAFATGGFFALFPVPGARRALFVGGAAWLAAGAALMVTYHLPKASLGYPIGLGFGYAYLWGYSAINVLSGLLIDCLVNRRLFPALFEAQPLAYLGRISYGMYVLHYPLQALTDRALPHTSLAVRLAVHVAATIALASVSFHLWEAPFVGFKNRWFRSAPA